MYNDATKLSNGVISNAPTLKSRERTAAGYIRMKVNAGSAVSQNMACMKYFA